MGNNEYSSMTGHAMFAQQLTAGHDPTVGRGLEIRFGSSNGSNNTAGSNDTAGFGPDASRDPDSDFVFDALLHSGASFGLGADLDWNDNLDLDNGNGAYNEQASDATPSNYSAPATYPMPLPVFDPAVNGITSPVLPPIAPASAQFLPVFSEVSTGSVLSISAVPAVVRPGNYASLGSSASRPHATKTFADYPDGEAYAMPTSVGQ